YQFRRVGPQAVGIARSPARVNPDSAALHPSQLSQPLPECGRVSLPFRITFGGWHQHCDPPHAALLRMRGERPSSGGAAEKRDELAAPYHEQFSARLINEYPARCDCKLAHSLAAAQTEKCRPPMG